MSEAVFLKLPRALKENADIYVKGGYFGNRSELIREAIREFLTKLEKDRMNIAIDMYRNGRISLGRASEISCVGYEKMKEILIERGIPILRGPMNVKELSHDYEVAKSL